MKDVESKWKWIARQCGNLGFEEAHILADEIEEGLKALYDITVTPKWRRDYDEIEENINAGRTRIIYDVCGNVDYCIGCVKTLKLYRPIDTPFCSRCRFGGRYGICTENGSLFERFLCAVVGDKR